MITGDSFTHFINRCHADDVTRILSKISDPMAGCKGGDVINFGEVQPVPCDVNAVSH